MLGDGGQAVRDSVLSHRGRVASLPRGRDEGAEPRIWLRSGEREEGCSQRTLRMGQSGCADWFPGSAGVSSGDEGCPEA